MSFETLNHDCESPCPSERNKANQSCNQNHRTAKKWQTNGGSTILLQENVAVLIENLYDRGNDGRDCFYAECDLGLDLLGRGRGAGNDRGLGRDGRANQDGVASGAVILVAVVEVVLPRETSSG